MDDYTGATRFQWTDAELDVASRARTLMPAHVLVDPGNQARKFPLRIARPDPVKLAEIDPSEAADSGRILDVILQYFPTATVKPTGGCIYHLALKDVIGNFGERDTPLLEALLLLDESLAGCGSNLYSVAISRSSG